MDLKNTKKNIEKITYSNKESKTIFDTDNQLVIHFYSQFKLLTLTV